MINVHLNGDIVRCPDIAAIHLRAQEIRDQHKICIYNYYENSCITWQNTKININGLPNSFCGGRCNLIGTENCPGHLKRKETGNQKKSYKIDNNVYRKVISAGHYLIKESKNKTLFITLTFPRFKKKISYEQINQYFSKFVHNLRDYYGCEGYIAVREFGEKTHRVHFHLLCSMPFIKFNVLNDTWCNCIKDICAYSRNALTTSKKTLYIRNPIRALRYICKYISKSKGQVNKSRLVFISKNIIQKPRQMRQSSEYGFLDSYKFDFQMRTSDYTTCFRITDFNEFNRFCEEFLYPFFELSVINQETFYAFPGSSLNSS